MIESLQPDIVLIVLDTSRVDRFSCYGYERDTTPYLDAFAEKATLFENAISPAQWTIPAHASLFTGEYPTTHMTHQIFDKHSTDYPTLAELLQRQGYQTVGFCNNPLLGVVKNDLDRGFGKFYNYGGMFPERPPVGDSRPRVAGRWMQQGLRHLNRLNQPIQELFTRNNLLLGIMMHPLISPFWQRHINFKGHTRQSLADMLGYLRTRERRTRERPIFTFLNLMEAHLPFGPPTRFIRKFAPYYHLDREARDFMGAYNCATYRWITPIIEPFTELEDQVLNDMYDAEIAYQDYLLRQLLDYLAQPEVGDHTLVIIVADHGEGLNHHGYVGHSLAAYNDLVHVPLLVRYPRLFPEGRQVSTPISTRRVFHTVLQAATKGAARPENETLAEEVETLSLNHALNGSDPEQGLVFSEAFPPQTMLALMETRTPDAIDTFRCRSVRRAMYASSLIENQKLVTVDEKPEELFDVVVDPAEVDNLITTYPDNTSMLSALLTASVDKARLRRSENTRAAPHLEFQDKDLVERLRGLGYLD